MILRHRRLQREVSDAYLRVALRDALFRRHVAEFGQRLHRGLGTAGLIASGFGAGFVFDRLRPHWRGVRSAGGLGMALLRIGPIATGLGDLIGKLFRSSG